MQFDCIVWSNSIFGQLLTLYDDVEGYTSVNSIATRNTSFTMTSPNIKTIFTCSCIKNCLKDHIPGNDKDKDVENMAFDQHFVTLDCATFTLWLLKILPCSIF